MLVLLHGNTGQGAEVLKSKGALEISKTDGLMYYIAHSFLHIG